MSAPMEQQAPAQAVSRFEPLNLYAEVIPFRDQDPTLPLAHLVFHWSEDGHARRTAVILPLGVAKKARLALAQQVKP